MAEVYRFADCVLDAGAGELRRGGVPVPVEPLVLDLIRVLLERPGQVVSRDALMKSVWKGRIVSESTISTAVKWARRALGDTGREQACIRTIRGRGIKLVVPVVVDRAALQPAIYVRPFGVLGDADLEPPARALRIRTRSILGRIQLLRIVAAFPEADLVTDPRELRARFGVTLVLDVRVQRDGARLVADAALTGTRDGLQIWAQRFEAAAGAGEQEILLHTMLRRLEPRVMQAMVAELQAGSGEPGARANLLQAIALLALKGWHRTTFVEAAGMIELAIAQEPDLALSHAYLALIKAMGHRVGLLRDDDTLVPSVMAAVERALELENRDSTILGLVGCALADVGQVDRALPMLHRAIEADPQNGHAQTALGAACMVKRDFAGAVRYLTAGMACSPADSRLSVWGAALAMAHLALGDMDAALAAAELACREDDRIYLPRLALAAVCLARRDESRAVAAARECLRTKADLSRAEVVGVVGERLGEGVWALVRTVGER